MRIGFDLRPFYTGSRFRGIGTYVKNLLEELLALDKENEYHFLNVYGRFPHDLPTNGRCFVHSYYAGPMIADCGERNLYRIPELDNVRKAQVQDFLHNSQIDIMFFPSVNEYGNMFKAEWFDSVRTVGIVYDMIPLLFPEQCLYDPVYKKDYMDSLDFLKKMDALLAISNATKKDIVEYCNIKEEKITVIYTGIDNRYLHFDRENYIPPRSPADKYQGYFLFAGGIDFKKNIENIIVAFSKLDRKKHNNVNLVVVGKASQDTIQHYMDVADQCNIADSVIFTGYVSDDELMALYCQAKALVFPSLYEGFGLPVVEAMACGTPVITSNSSSLKEIAEGYAILVHPERVQEIYLAMKHILDAPEEMKVQAQKAIAHAREFSWKNVAEKTLEIIKALNRGFVPTKIHKDYFIKDFELAAIAQEHSNWNVEFTSTVCQRVAEELLALENGGFIPAYPIGKRILFDVTVVRDWAKNNYVTGIGRVCLRLYDELSRMADVMAVSKDTVGKKLVFRAVDMDTYEIKKDIVEITSGDIYFMPELQLRGIQIPRNYPRVGQLQAAGVKTYAVIHDILPVNMPQYFQKKTAEAFPGYIEEILTDYDGILAVSKSAADSWIEYCKKRQNMASEKYFKIGFFHNGVDNVLVKEAQHNIASEVKTFFDGQTFLMVGTVEPRKGYEIVLKVFEELWDKDFAGKLCVIGHIGWNMQSLVKGMKNHAESGNKLLFIEAASDAVLSYAYQHAAALIQASAGEGFGLPLIEAGAYGLPVICSDIPVFHEVAGEYALYFDRSYPTGLQKILLHFSQDSDNGLIPDSRKIKSATWNESACSIANKMLADADWYKEILPSGEIIDAEPSTGFYQTVKYAEPIDKEGTSAQDVEKAVLLVYPNNLLRGGQGNNNYVLSLIRLLKEFGYAVDLFSFENFTPESTFIDYQEENKEGLIRNLYLYDFSKGYKEESARRCHFSQNKFLQDWTRPGMHLLFEEAIQQHHYVVIGVFYSFLANLFVDADIKAKRIYFMLDSMFLQQSSWDVDKTRLGQLMDEELSKLKFFDEILCISYDEKIMYEKLLSRPIGFLPYIIPVKANPVITPVRDRKYDVAFVGFDNPFNVEGLQWFIDKVYPMLNQDIKAVFVGSVTKKIQRVPSSVTIIPFAPDLKALFDDVKIAICPMFKGTGMKTKVVEAMAYGIPIVCNERGIDGFPDKLLTGCIVTDDAEEFAKAINHLLSDEQFYREKAGQIQKYYKELFDREKYKRLLLKVV